MKILIFLTFILFFKIVSTQKSCGIGWIPYKDQKCYRLIENVFGTFESSRQACASLKDSADNIPTLPIILTNDEQNFLADFIFQKSKKLDSFWISARYTAKGKYVWIDTNEQLDYSNWDTTRTIDNETDYCVEMEADKSVQGKWTSKPCLSSAMIVCQKMQVWSLVELQQVLMQNELKNIKQIEILENQLQEQNKNFQTQIQNLNNKFNEKLQNSTAEIQHLKLNVVPVGFIYVQLPDQPEPKSLWPWVQWQEITGQYAGLFFRAEGGGSAPFGQEQAGDSPRLVQVNENWPLIHPSVGQIQLIPGTLSTPIDSGLDGGEARIALSFLVSNTETRPRNKSIKIWKRV